ncbi:MAG: hypothetical protein ACOH2E_07925 [Candidatus Paracaedibacter sp.]
MARKRFGSDRSVHMGHGQIFDDVLGQKGTVQKQLSQLPSVSVPASRANRKAGSGSLPDLVPRFA